MKGETQDGTPGTPNGQRSDSEYDRFQRALKKVLSAPKKRVDEALERERRERESKRG